MFIISTSFCILSAETNILDLSQSNNASQQDSIISIDVQPTVAHDAFFKSLVKDIGSNRVEYKNGKILVYITPPLFKIIQPAILATIPLIISLLGLVVMHDTYNTEMYIKALFSVIIFGPIACVLLYNAGGNFWNRWIENNPLISIGECGIRYKNECTVSWDDINDIVQKKIFTQDRDGIMQSNHVITCIGPLGTEVFELSENSYLPITLNAIIELLNKVFCRIKQKNASLATHPYQNESLDTGNKQSSFTTPACLNELLK